MRRPFVMRSLAGCWLGAIVCLQFGCESAAHEPAGDIHLEAYSWWKAQGETDGFDTLVLPFERSHPEVQEVRNYERNDSAETSGDLSERLLAGGPPNTFQANGGADLLRWVAVDFESESGAAGAAGSDRVDHVLLEDLGPMLRGTGAYDAIYPEVRAAICAHVDGKDQLFSVPVNVHRLNLLYYNIEKVDELGGAEELFGNGICPDDPSDAAPPFTIAIDDENFPLVVLTFENLFLGLTSGESYTNFFKGEPDEGWRADMDRVLDCLWYLSRSFISAQPWDKGIPMVAEGHADITITGDWANPEFENALESELDSTIGRMPFPGTENYFVFASDTFPRPKAATLPKYTDALLRSFTNFDTQVAFSQAKGSIPALARATPPELSAWGLQTLNDFENKNVTKVLATSGWLPSYVLQPRLVEVLKKVTDTQEFEGLHGPTGSVTAVLAHLESSLPLLKRWQQRLEPCTNTQK